MPEPIVPGRPGLDRLQRFMLRIVTHPDGVDAGTEAAIAEGLLPHGATTLSEVVPGNDKLSPTEQLHIYAFAYFDRVIDVLAAELPTVQHLFGEEPFRDAMRQFLTDHPSATWTLDRVGMPLASWFEDRAPQSSDPLRWQVAADMARVERAMDAVWDEPFAEPVSYEELAAIATDQWAQARLTPIPAFRLLALGHPVREVMNAATTGQAPTLPASRAAWMCVYRDDSRRWRFPLDQSQFVLLSALERGATLGGAITQVAALPGTDVGALLGSLGDWFREWMGSGLFAQVEVVAESP